MVIEVLFLENSPIKNLPSSGIPHERLEARTLVEAFRWVHI